MTTEPPQPPDHASISMAQAMTAEALAAVRGLNPLTAVDLWSAACALESANRLLLLRLNDPQDEVPITDEIQAALDDSRAAVLGLTSALRSRRGRGPVPTVPPAGQVRS